jgi:hypothetical protein
VSCWRFWIPHSTQSISPNCDVTLADANQDGQVNSFDIDPFVALVLGN